MSSVNKNIKESEEHYKQQIKWTGWVHMCLNIEKLLNLTQKEVKYPNGLRKIKEI